MRRGYVVELVTDSAAQPLFLSSDSDAVRLFTKFSADYPHDLRGFCAPIVFRVTLAYVDAHGFEIPRPQHVPGLSGASVELSTQCPHEVLDAVLRMIQ